MDDKERNTGGQKYKNLNILITKKVFYMKQKGFFITVWGLSFGEKKEK